jgi:outer membrane immunogenic protein
LIGGKLMRRLFVALIILTALTPAVFASIASAADMPVKAPVPKAAKLPYDWSGLYLGGHIGYLWGRTRVEEDGEVTEPNAPTNGTIGGVMAGYNWQSGRVVFGLEGDFGWTNAHGTGNVAPPPPIIVTTQAPNTYDVNWTAHIRGRTGYAFDNWLLFIAGGFAVADFEFHEGAITTVVLPPPGGKYYGWSIGGGAEVAITRNLIGRVEYLYDDFGHKDYIGVTGDPYRVSFRAQTVRGALAWKFDPFGMRP